jgi:acylphosphatase
VIVARRFRVHGRVQGVGFRMFVLDAATAEGLGGWVGNTPDGAVEGRVEGDREAVDRFARQLARGPSLARVDRVEVEDDVPGGARRRFEVK